MENIRWVIQNNLISENDLNEIQKLVRVLVLSLKNFNNPFSDKLQNFSR
jgi:hypothetical protein